ncbi:MAG: NB-ARC domain-containing protein [Promethearchaeota archaeon]
MITQNQFIDDINKLLLDKTVISIYGASGTGKTTLSLQIVCSLLTKSYPYKDQCVWIQASERFSKKRLSQMFEKEKNRLDYLIKNIFLIPSDGPCFSYYEQSKIISNLYSDDFLLPPKVKFIVIDNVSHHLRFVLPKINEYVYYMEFINEFFSEQLYPLIMYCKRNQIKLILIHELSYNPNIKKNVPFLHKLFSRINSLTIVLLRDFFNQENKIFLKCNKNKWMFGYQLKDNGFIFI